MGISREEYKALLYSCFNDEEKYDLCVKHGCSFKELVERILDESEKQDN